MHHASDPEQELFERVRRGDRAAVERVLEMVRPRLEAYVASRLGDYLRGCVETADVVQESALRALRSIDRFQRGGEDAFFRWLAGIAHHVIQESARRAGRDFVAPLEAGVPAGGPSPETRCRRDERFERLEAALAGLLPDHRQVILLARIQRLPLKEVAERMGRTPEAVSQLLWRALRSLRERFGTTDSLHLPRRELEIDDRGGAP